MAKNPLVPVEEEEDGTDISLEEYLAEDVSSVTGKVRLHNGRLLTVGALTDDEQEKIRRASTVPDPKRGKGATRLDDVLYKRLLCAKSMVKASPHVDEATVLKSLETRLAWEVTYIVQRIMEISGFQFERDEVGRLVGFS